MNNSIEKIIRISIIIIAMVLLVIIKTMDLFMPKIYLETRNLNINVFDKYKGIKYQAFINGKDITDRVNIIGIVDTDHIGTYNVTYEVNNNGFKVKEILKVNVVDTIGPEINIEEYDNDICDIDTFTKNYVKVYDSYDGDINNISYVIDGDYISYTAYDSSNNISNRKVKLNKSKPKLVLNGDKEVYLKLNESYNELGVIATDSCNNDITDKVVIKNNVDNTNYGKYDVVYTVTDNNGVTNEIDRIVNVYDENSLGLIYLTFDDGPGIFTNGILDILSKYNIKATFFVTGYGSDEDILREYNDGHTVGLHTYTHKGNIYSSVDDYFNDLNKVKDRVKNITGKDTKITRFLGGSSNTISKAYSKGIMSTLTKKVEEEGYTYFDWNVSVEDAGACAKKRVKDKESCVYNYFVNGLSKDKTNIVLLHDIKEYTYNALENMIKYALDNNYEFLPITENTLAHHHHINN